MMLRLLKSDDAAASGRARQTPPSPLSPRKRTTPGARRARASRRLALRLLALFGVVVGVMGTYGALRERELGAEIEDEADADGGAGGSGGESAAAAAAAGAGGGVGGAAGGSRGGPNGGGGGGRSSGAASPATTSSSLAHHGRHEPSAPTQHLLVCGLPARRLPARVADVWSGADASDRGAVLLGG